MCVKVVFVALCEVYHLFLVYVSDLTSELCVLCVCLCVALVVVVSCRLIAIYLSSERAGPALQFIL